MKIKSLLSKNFPIEFKSEICGFVSRPIKKELKTAKEHMAKLNLPFLCLKQFSEFNEQDLFLVNSEVKTTSIFTDYEFDKHKYLTIVNPRIIRKFELVDSVEECPSFPCLEIKTKRYNSVELYSVDEKMDAESKMVKGNRSLIIQNCMDTNAGYVLISPLRHKGEISIKRGYEKLFPDTYSILGEFKQFSKDFKMTQDPRDYEYRKNMNLASVIQFDNLELEEKQEFRMFKSVLMMDYKNIREKSKSELINLIHDDNKRRLSLMMSLLSGLEIN